MSHPIPTFAFGFLMFLYFLVFYRTGQVTFGCQFHETSNCSSWCQPTSTKILPELRTCQNYGTCSFLMVIRGERISFGMPSDCQMLFLQKLGFRFGSRIFENEVPMQQKCNKYPDITPSNFKRPKNSKPSGIRDQEILSFFHVWLE